MGYQEAFQTQRHLLMVTAHLLQGLLMMILKPGHYAKVAQALRTLTSLMLCRNKETFKPGLQSLSSRYQRTNWEKEAQFGICQIDRAGEYAKSHVLRRAADCGIKMKGN